MSSTVSLDEKTKIVALASDLSSFKVEEEPGIVRFENAVTACEMFADLVAVMLGILLSYVVYQHLSIGKHERFGSRGELAVVFGFAVFFMLMLDRAGAYHPGNSLLRVKETERVLRTSALTFMLVFPASFFSGLYLPRLLLVISALVVSLLVSVEKHGIYLLVRSLHSKGYGVRKVVIYGAGSTGRRVFSALVRSPKVGLSPVLVVDDEAENGAEMFELGYLGRRSAPIVQGPPTAELLRETGATRLIIAIPSLSSDLFLRAVTEAFTAGVSVSFVPNHGLPGEASVDHVDIDGLLLSSVTAVYPRPVYEFVKRILDVCLASLLFVVASPIMLVMAALIKSDSSGSAIFVQKRVGLNGRIFNLYKFRTMLIDAPAYDFSPIDPTDSRITLIGRFLRRTSMDELPQLWNIIKGDMSLVGPRPEMPFIVEKYDAVQSQRLRVKPGLTGLWQLSADRSCLIHENIEYDIYYIKNRGLFMDLAVLVHTLFFAMRGI